MLSIIIFLLVSVANTQYYYPQQQYLLNNYNSGSSYSQNYPTWNPAIQQSKQKTSNIYLFISQNQFLDQASVRGNLLNDDPSVLPYGSRIIVSLTDVSLQDVAARPLNTFTIQARIEKDGQLLYINDQYTPVRLIPTPVNPVNIVMKKVGVSMDPSKCVLISHLFFILF